jgi:hypothetical protein
MEYDLLGTKNHLTVPGQNWLYYTAMGDYMVAQRAQKILETKQCRGLDLFGKWHTWSAEEHEGRAGYRCHQMFCPACWLVTQTRIADLVARLSFDWWYIRETWLAGFGEDLHPKVIKRFRGTGHKYTTVGWVLSPTTGSNEGAYQYIGIYGSNGPAPLQDRFTSVSGRVLAKGKQVGIVTSETFWNRDEVMDVWAERVIHPSVMRNSPDYSHWIEHAALQFAEQARSHVAIDLVKPLLKPLT